MPVINTALSCVNTSSWLSGQDSVFLWFISIDDVLASPFTPLGNGDKGDNVFVKGGR